VTGPPVKLLLTSVGGLVGHNILDVLEYPDAPRRSLVQVVGTNSQPDAAANFRCDRCYLVPPTAAAEYPARMSDILWKESPDLILCGRDEDTYVLAQLKSRHPELPGVLPIGPPRAALIGLDKWQTWLFAHRHGLPFAESFMPGESGDEAALEAFCRRVGYPLVAKPTKGAGSRGVCFVRNTADAEAISQRQAYLFQEYIGDPQNLEPYFAALQGPPPLFAQHRHADYHVCYTVIAPTGDFPPVATAENKTEYGHTYLTARVVNPTIEAITAKYARALFSEGGAGPMNVQFRQNRDGTWKGLEVNLRTSGGMLARFMKGVDELGRIIKAFVPDTSFPELHLQDSDQCHRVFRQYYSYPVSEKGVAALQRTGVWSPS
jgi:hypothetical protein